MVYYIVNCEANSHQRGEVSLETVYAISQNAVVIEGSNILLTYGIVAKNSKGEKISEFCDVSVNRDFTERVINLLNKCEIEPCHFHDVVLDELNR